MRVSTEFRPAPIGCIGPFSSSPSLAHAAPTTSAPSSIRRRMSQAGAADDDVSTSAATPAPAYAAPACAARSATALVPSSWGGSLCSCAEERCGTLQRFTNPCAEEPSWSASRVSQLRSGESAGTPIISMAERSQSPRSDTSNSISSSRSTDASALAAIFLRMQMLRS